MCVSASRRSRRGKWSASQAAGYRVIEVNTSADRGGAAMLRLVGEATQSQRVSAPQAPAPATKPQPQVARGAVAALFGKAAAAANEAAGA